MYPRFRWVLTPLCSQASNAQAQSSYSQFTPHNMMSRQILKLKNFQTSARIRLPTTSGLSNTLQAKRSLALYNTTSEFRLVNKEPSSGKTTTERPTIYSDGEVETAGPSIRV